MSVAWAARLRGTSPEGAVLVVVAAVVLLFLVFPVAVIVPISFSATSGLQFPPPAYGFGRYLRLLNSPEWLAAIGMSARVAFLATLLATPVGFALSLGLVRGRFRGKGLLQGLLLAPLIVPTIIYALALFFFYRQVGLFDDPAGLTLAYAVISLPYIVLVASARLKAFDESLELAAMSMGASWPRALWHVTLPLTWPAILAGALLAFIHSFDELIIALFVTGFRTETLPRKLFSSFTNEVDPLLSVVSTLLVGLSVAVGIAASLAARRRT